MYRILYASAPIIRNNRIQIQRRENLWTLLTKGIKHYEIAKVLDVDPATVSRDIAYLAAQSQNYLNDLAKIYLAVYVSNFN